MNLNWMFPNKRGIKNIRCIMIIGIFILSLASPGITKTSDPEDRMKKLELEQERTNAVNAVANLFSKYQYYMWARMHDEQTRLFALKTPGVKAQLASMGIFEGASGIQKMHEHMASIEGDGTGVMIVNLLATP